mmetsp:Transcript_48160/g.78226  ORF Transcript_48160/g.78226 Transcript_48160/m.78226 type:complete len:207 (+) Transcript_48160:1745-2365(+)
MAMASISFLGPTTLATLSYVSIARTHMQRPQAAWLQDFTRAGWKSSRLMKSALIFFTTEAGMLSLSNVCNDFRKSDSLTILIEGPQKSSTIAPASFLTRTPLMPFIMQTACRTILTGAGGFFIALISPMSLEDNVSKAPRASWSAGIASSKSASTDAFWASEEAATVDAASSSFETLSFTTAVFSDSPVTTTTIASTSVVFSTNLG